MQTIDPDVLAVLAEFGSIPERARLVGVRKRQQASTERRVETQLELLSDELAEVIPKSNPLFEVVLMLTVLRKAQRQQEPEFRSFLEFPEDL